MRYTLFIYQFFHGMITFYVENIVFAIKLSLVIYIYIYITGFLIITWKVKHIIREKLLKNQRNPNDASYAPTSENNWTREFIFCVKKKKKIVKRRRCCCCFSYSDDVKPFDIKSTVVTGERSCANLIIHVFD